MMAWTIRSATPEDLPAILGLFDEAVVWLNAQGVTGQWGTTPLSQSAEFRKRLEAGMPHGFVAEADRVEGFVYMTLTPPSYWPIPTTEDAGYAHGLVASRALQARGVGTVLLQWAQHCAVQQGKQFLRLDCWAENPKLIAYYERRGFTCCGNFAADGWQGALLEKILD